MYSIKVGCLPCSSRSPWGAPPWGTPPRTSAYDTSWNLGFQSLYESDVRAPRTINRAFTRLTTEEAPGVARGAAGASITRERSRDFSRLSLFVPRAKLSVTSTHRRARSCSTLVIAFAIAIEHSVITTASHDRRFPLETTQARARPTVTVAPRQSRHDATDYACITCTRVSDDPGSSPIVAPQIAPPHAGSTHANERTTCVSA